MRVRLAILIGACLTVCVACGSNSSKSEPAAPPPPPTSAVSTTITGYTQHQVMGWVTPTLDNGIAFVTRLPAGAPYAQVVRAAQSLSTACTVAQSELNQVSWTGEALPEKTSLASVLSQTVALVASPSPATFPTLLQGDIQSITTRLSGLNRDVPA